MSHQIERICLSVNSVCNLACTYCYFFAIPEALPGPEALSEDEIFTVLARAEDYARRPAVHKKIKINFVGSGEPLLSWPAIRGAIQRLQREAPDHRLRFYTVTNAILLTRQIADEMKALGLTPSVSLDGPPELHDRYRVKRGGQGTYQQVLRGIELLREAGFVVAINTVLTRSLIARMREYLEFAAQHGFQKIIFDRLVDVPDELRPLSYEEFYRALRHIAELREALGLHDLEIGNLEAYRRAIAGAADRVCTMFGSTCGAGVNNLMYMQREVYPCGRMFHQPGWRLGRFDEPLALFPERMAERLAASPASRHRTAEDGPAGPDCIIEQERGDYSARARDEFVAWYAAWLQRTPARTTAGPTVTAWPTFEDDEPDSRPSALIPAARLTVRPM